MLSKAIRRLFVSFLLCASIDCTVPGFGLPSAPLAALQKNVGAGTMNAFAQPAGIKQGKGTSLALSSEVSSGGAVEKKSSGVGIDIPLLIYFGLWYLGNYYVSQTLSSF
mmetsp:Transcript_1740/g.2654  ORF Transcript_1740/g.2654 Transcript_1740/m.2654 type:complete len:109 (+) Transcript_1740:460-786(+)